MDRHALKESFTRVSVILICVTCGVVAYLTALRAKNKRPDPTRAAGRTA